MPEPLPLFGYDFFQPARQIILARRRALLPRPATSSAHAPRLREQRRAARTAGSRSNGRQRICLRQFRSERVAGTKQFGSLT